MSEFIYSGDIVAGSLLVKESRCIAALLIEGVGKESFYDKVMEDNVLQKRSPASAKRQARLVLHRLEIMDLELWHMVRDGSHELATQALFCAAIKRSRLLGDFIKNTVTSKVAVFQQDLSYKDWNSFFEECKQIDSSLGDWSESTVQKIRQVVIRILAEAHVIDSTRSMKILGFYIIPELKSYLVRNNEEYVLKCLGAFQ